MNSVFRALFWVKDVFAAEFGNSDVQSNYSRLYAWMANQLGHMTLGLATALAFIWIFETLHDLALREGGAWYASGGARLLNFGGLVMLVGVGCVVAAGEPGGAGGSLALLGKGRPVSEMVKARGCGHGVGRG